jgi:hypothetical protein
MSEPITVEQIQRQITHLTRQIDDEMADLEELQSQFEAAKANFLRVISARQAPITNAYNMFQNAIDDQIRRIVSLKANFEKNNSQRTPEIEREARELEANDMSELVAKVDTAFRMEDTIPWTVLEPVLQMFPLHIRPSPITDEMTDRLSDSFQELELLKDGILAAILRANVPQLPPKTPSAPPLQEGTTPLKTPPTGERSPQEQAEVTPPADLFEQPAPGTPFGEDSDDVVIFGDVGDTPENLAVSPPPGMTPSAEDLLENRSTPVPEQVRLQERLELLIQELAVAPESQQVFIENEIDAIRRQLDPSAFESRWMSASLPLINSMV